MQKVAPYIEYLHFQWFHAEYKSLKTIELYTTSLLVSLLQIGGYLGFPFSPRTSNPLSAKSHKKSQQQHSSGSIQVVV